SAAIPIEMRQTSVQIVCWVGVLLIHTLLRGEEFSERDPDLARKAAQLQSLVETKLLQQHGMIPMLVRATDYQLPTAEDYQGAYRHRHLRGKTEAELGMPPMHVWRAWENTAANTAYYLYATAFQ